jgi:hypothetical protein
MAAMRESRGKVHERDNLLDVRRSDTPAAGRAASEDGPPRGQADQDAAASRGEIEKMTQRPGRESSVQHDKEATLIRVTRLPQRVEYRHRDAAEIPGEPVDVGSSDRRGGTIENVHHGPRAAVRSHDATLKYGEDPVVPDVQRRKDPLRVESARRSIQSTTEKRPGLLRRSRPRPETVEGEGRHRARAECAETGVEVDVGQAVVKIAAEERQVPLEALLLL